MGRKPKQEFVNVTQFCRTKRLNYTDFLGLVNYFKPPIVYEDARQKVFRYGDLNKLYQMAEEMKIRYHKTTPPIPLGDTPPTPR